MPLIICTDWYSEQLLQANPDCYFVFGDNLQRVGKGGQAVIRDEPNAIGVVTKIAPTMSDDAFFSDKTVFEAANCIILVGNDLNRVEELLMAGATVFWPSTGIGTERAELKTRAPHLLTYIETIRDRLLAQYPATE